MTFREKRCKFTIMLGQLIIWMNLNGYETAIDDVKTQEGHSKNSLHKIGLAADINLYKDGKWLRKTEDHLEAGLYWESLGGSWGGRFKDGNHYSLKHEGRR